MFSESNWCSTMKVTFEGHGVRYVTPQASNIGCLKYMATTSDCLQKIVMKNSQSACDASIFDDVRIEWSRHILY